VIGLTGVLATVAEACGQGAALALASAFGGRELYVPAADSIGEDHPLARALGLASARRCADALSPPGRRLIPMGPTSTPRRRREAILRMKAEPKSHSFIAQALGIHLRTVERVVAAAGLTADDSQPGLFD
jgi:hypothetical protein